MFVERLTVEDYQDLLDRGWRRSGSYVYKPKMETTCCPLYTIRCPAAEFSPSKSQRRAASRLHRFLREGGQPVGEKGAPAEQDKAADGVNKEEPSTGVVAMDTGLSKMKRIEGLKKKKVLRMEKKMKKISEASKQDTEDTSRKAANIPKNRPKSMGDILPQQNQLRLGESVVQEVGPAAAHSFSLRMVRASLEDPTFRESLQESYAVYRDYQLTIHGDSESECDIRTWGMFLCDSPLLPRTERGVELGAFHQQYVVDGRIVAVAVLDILPACISSVYLYYSPAFWGRRLSPGTYSALREVQLTRELGLLLPSIQHYYMGYYVHSCPKMRYKAQLRPSHLLSPTQLSWRPLPPCLPLLDASSYSTLEEVPALQAAPAALPLNVGRVRLLVGSRLSTWAEVGPHMNLSN
jgi:arginine-tRNA-protein transferase